VRPVRAPRRQPGGPVGTLIHAGALRPNPKEQQQRAGNGFAARAFGKMSPSPRRLDTMSTSTAPSAASRMGMHLRDTRAAGVSSWRNTKQSGNGNGKRVLLAR
jgi:hypothetical protein